MSTTGNGYLGSPGLYNDAQIPGWEAITEAVHAKGGRIFLQLFHAGRQSHSDMQPDGAPPVAPSQVDYNGLIVAAGGFTATSAEQILQAGEAALVAFGRDFIANPRLAGAHSP